jgi:hypothetical protein
MDARGIFGRFQDWRLGADPGRAGEGLVAAHAVRAPYRRLGLIIALGPQYPRQQTIWAGSRSEANSQQETRKNEPPGSQKSAY